MVSSSYISLDGIRIRAHHGVLDQERLVGGDFHVSVRVDYPLARAVETDDVGDTLNYAELHQLVCREMATPSRLLEHAAGRIGKAVLARWSEASRVTVRLTKDNPPMGGDCDGATVEMTLVADEHINQEFRILATDGMTYADD